MVTHSDFHIVMLPNVSGVAVARVLLNRQTAQAHATAFGKVFEATTRRFLAFDNVIALCSTSCWHEVHKYDNNHGALHQLQNVRDELTAAQEHANRNACLATSQSHTVGPRRSSRHKQDKSVD